MSAPLRFHVTVWQDEDPEIFALLSPLPGKARARLGRRLMRTALGLPADEQPTTVSTAPSPTAPPVAPPVPDPPPRGLAALGLDPMQFRFTTQGTP